MRMILYAVPIMGSVEWWKMQGKVTYFVILMIAKSLLNQLWDTRNIFRPCLITWLPICSDTGFYLFSILSSLRKQLCFSLLVFSTGDISHGGTSGSQQQEFHTNDVNQCLHSKSDSHGVPMQICSISHFSWSILLKCCVSANKLQQNSNASSREDYIPQILTVLLEIHRIYIWPLPPFVCHLWTIAKTIELLCWPISASDRILDRCDVFSMEFLSLSCRRSSSQNFPNGQERGEMAAFAC